jgi:cell division protease FtsH
MKIINSIGIFCTLLQVTNSYFLSGIRQLDIKPPIHLIKNTEFGPLETENLSDLYKRLEKHEIKNIYFSENLKQIYYTDKEICVPSYENCMKVVNSNPIITDKIIELSTKNNVNTLIIDTPYNIFNDAGKILGNAVDFLIVSFILTIVVQTLSLFFGSGTGNQRPMNGMNLPFLNNKEKLIDKTILNTSFSQWGGSPEVFEECVEIVSYIKNNTLYKNAGADIPKGILLEGLPGTGKTLIAKAIAKETNASFLSISASEFVEVYVGLGASKMRDLFREAREEKEKNGAAIIFIDEIDAVGKKRGSSNMMGTNDEREQTLNQLLSEMDGFEPNTNIIVIAATNRKDVLDPALLRPGRFDRIIYVPLPDKKSREEIFKIYMKTKQVEENISLDFLAEMTSGFSGAQIKNLLNEAAINTARNGSTIINQEHLENALEKIIIGITKKVDTRSDEMRNRVAVHELGHTILAAHYKDDFELVKVSMKSTYSGVGGYTLFNEIQSKNDGNGMYTKDILKKRLAIGLAGKAAEYIYYGENMVSLGAFEDLKQANKLAKTMIKNYGMGKDLEVFFDSTENAFEKSYSEKTNEKIDEESMSLLYEAYEEAKTVITNNKEVIDKLVKILLKENVISGEKVYSILHT